MDVTWFGREYQWYSEPLTDEDRLELGRQMAEAQGKIDDLVFQLKEIRSDYKSRIEEVSKTMSEAGIAMRRGTKDAEKVKCDVWQDWDTEEIVYVTADDRRIEVSRRPMKPEERQRSMFTEPPEDYDGPVVDAEIVTPALPEGGED